MEDPVMPDRLRRAEDRAAPVKFAISVLGGLLALATLVWGAARIASSVDNMNVAVTDLRSTTEALKSTITGILVQQARNQAEIEAIKARLDGARMRP
jgi:hypothetical protein